MNEELRSKLAKVYELVNRGATDGEREAAKKALDRIIEKYNIDESMLSEIELKKYKFTYGSEIEKELLALIIKFFAPHAFEKTFRGTKYLLSSMVYTDWVLIESAYEYFRRHAKQQWLKLCSKEVARCRKAKTKNKRRKQLQELFITQYAIKSNLVKTEQIRRIVVTDKNEITDRMMLQEVEGGNFNKQVISNHLLEN